MNHLRTPLLTGLTALAVTTLTANLHAQTLRVTTSGDDDASGYTWASSLRTLREALARAAADDGITRIEVGAGTYKPGGSRWDSFELVSGVAVVGGYGPTGSAGSYPDVYQTVLSGDIGVNGDHSDNCYSVVLALNVENVRLEGVSVRHGMYDASFANGPVAFGGGLYAENASLQLRDCVFSRNVARMGGGLALLNGVAASITRCRFVRNSGVSGGAIVNGSNDQDENDVLVDRCWLGSFALFFTAYNTIPNKAKFYDASMDKIQKLESEALDILKKLKSSPDDQKTLQSINEVGIPNFNKCDSILQEIKGHSYPSHIEKHNAFLQDYISLRLKSFGLLKQSIEKNTDKYLQEFQDVNLKIQELVTKKQKDN